MSEIKVQDGIGSGRSAAVDGRHRLQTSTVQQTEIVDAVKRGNAYNLNTGIMSLTDSSTSAVIYFKNNEDEDYVISALAMGIGDRPSPTDQAIITMVRNPTGGTIVTDATPIDMNQNRNFGSNQTLSANIYKGGQGKTLTGGDDVAIFYSGSGRLFATIDFDLPKGTSMGITVDVNDATGADIYCALVGYLKDGAA